MRLLLKLTLIYLAIMLNSSCDFFNDPKRQYEQNVEVKPEKKVVRKSSAGQAEILEQNEKIKTIDLTIGKGKAASSGDKLSVKYVGTFENGKIFDSSIKRGKPFSFELGKDRVIKGWEQGILGMKVGGIRKITIPPSLAYGKRGISGVIPPSSTLIFTIDLLKIEENQKNRKPSKTALSFFANSSPSRR